MCVCGGGGGGLSRAVYLDPHPPGYQCKIILLILLISNHLNVEMYSSQIQLFSLSHCFCMLSCRGGGQAVQGSLSSPHLGINVQLF